ncbi:MAG: hypothetical protein MUF83_12675 [Acidimicrobiales bacterium]|nr:hypothetical protein [Acidimicrobiales bacterium]
MEIVEFLAARRHRVAALLLVPVVAVALTAAFSVDQGERYQSSVVVEVPSDGADGRAVQLQAAERFAALVVSPQVAAAVADDIGVPAPEIAQGVTTSRDETEVEVRLALTRPGDTSRRALVALTAEAARRLFEAPRVESQAAIEAAQDRQAQAEAALAAFELERGATAAPIRYQEILDAQAELRRLRQEARAAGRTGEAEEYQVLIDEYEAARLALEPLLPEYRALQGDVNRAGTQIDTAQLRADDLAAREAGLVERAGADASQAELVDATTLLLRRSLAAGAVGIVLAAALLAILEVLRPVRADDGMGADPGSQEHPRDGGEDPACDAGSDTVDDPGEGTATPPERLVPSRVEVRGDGSLVVS